MADCYTITGTGQDGQREQMNINTINSISDYIQWVQSIRDDAESNGCRIFFRGQSKESFELTPSVYRMIDGKSFRDNEYSLYQEMLRRDPSAFADCQTTFEKLVKMQHHGLPTRLLDLTFNPLVALYFACNDHSGENGKVFAITCLPENVQYQYDLFPEAFVGLEGHKYNFYLIPQKAVAYYKTTIKHEMERMKRVAPLFTQQYISDYAIGLSNWLSILDSQSDEMPLELTIRFVLEFSATTSSFIDNTIYAIREKYSQEQESKERVMLLGAEGLILEAKVNWHENSRALISILREAFGIYQGTLREDKIDRYLMRFLVNFIVYPPLNNERLIRQQGLFLLFSPFELPDVYDKAYKTFEIIVDGSSKEQLIKDLARLGIDEAFLFPELTTQAKEIKKMYPAS